MQFKKLKIRGFKGFADPVELPIREGLSGVVGPNGCGKSNLVEAFGWVMGENRPTVMRGGSMEDVIFSGAATRPASSLAEVELEIDNSDGRISSEFASGGEVSVARRVERDGGSTFLINGKDVRWRDVQLLFADSASGARSSALVTPALQRVSARCSPGFWSISAGGAFESVRNRRIGRWSMAGGSMIVGAYMKCCGNGEKAHEDIDGPRCGIREYERPHRGDCAWRP